MKEYKLGAEGREVIKDVSTFVGKTLGKTLGLAGRNYFLTSGITNDGRTIISELRDKRPCHDQIALAFHEVARQQDKDAGDGTTTAMVMTAEMTLDNIEKVSDIDTPIPGQQTSLQLSQSLQEASDKAIEILETKKIPVESLGDMIRVAYTAVEHDEGARIIANACWDAGKDSRPILDYGLSGKIEADVVKGVSYKTEIAHDSLFNYNDRAEYDHMMVLTVNHNFEEWLEVAPFMQTVLSQKQRPANGLVIVAKRFSVAFISSAAKSATAKFPVMLVTTDDADVMKDIASYTGATYVDTHPKTGRRIMDVSYIDAGMVQKAIATATESKFVGGKGFETGMENYIQGLEEQIEASKDEKAKTKLEERRATLLGGIATIYVDAKTLPERYYLKLKVEDAINSCKAALNSGMVKGAGVALMEIAEELGKDSPLYKALMKPHQRILMNNGGEPVDTEGIYDAFDVVKCGIENAVSVTKTLLSIEGIVADAPKDDFKGLIREALNGE